MKKTAILSILLSLCMVVTLLTGIPASAATFNLDSYADIPTHIEPNESGYNYYFFTMEEAGTLTVTGNTSFELGSRDDDSKYDFTEYDMGGTVSLQVVAGERMKLTYGYNDKGIDLVVTFEAGVAEEPGEGGEEEEIDTTVLEGTYEAGYAGLMPDMWVLTFNNGILSIQDNNNGKYTGSYDYSVDADGMITISGDDGTMGVIGTPGNYTFFCGDCTAGVAMVKTANASSGEEGGDEPVLDSSNIEGVWEAGFPMMDFWGYKLTFNNGTLTIEDNNGGIYSGDYTYTAAGNSVTVTSMDGFSIYADMGGTWYIQLPSMSNTLTMRKIAELEGGDVGGGDEPVDPPVDPDEGDLVVGENSIQVENPASGTEVTFTATEDGTYTVTMTDANAWVYCEQFYGWMQDGETQDITLAAGESFTLIVSTSNDQPDTIEFTIEKSEEEPAPEGPISIWGPSSLNEQYSEISLGAGQSQEFKFYSDVNGILIIEGYYCSVTINGEKHNLTYYPLSIQLSAEDAVNVDDFGMAYVSIILESSYAGTIDMHFELPLGSGENPEELDSLHKVEHTLTAENYYYTWTADFTGELTIWLNQGVDGAKVDITIHDEARENYASLWDWETNSAKENLTISVVEGTVYTIEVIEYGDDDGNTIGGDIIFSNREALVADGSSNDPFDLEEGKMELVMEAGKSEEGLYYIYTPSGNGILTITIQDWDGTALYISGGGMVKQDNGYTFIAEVTEGEQIKLNFWLLSDAACDMDLTVEFTDESEIEYAVGTEQNPEEIDSIDGLVFTVNNSDYYYKWTATESGTLTITLSTTWGYGYNLLVNGESLFGNGETMEIEVAVGDEIVLVNSVYASADSNGSITLSAEFGDGSDVPSAGDYTFLVFALMAMSMTALVVLVSKKRAF